MSGLTKVCSVLVAGLGSIALLGWILRIPLLTAYGASWKPMAPSTALLFLLLGGVQFLSVGSEQHRRVFVATMSIGSCVAATGILVFLSFLRREHSPVDWLDHTISGHIVGAPIEHMSPTTALCFVVSASAFLLVFSSFSDKPARTVTAFALSGLLVLASSLFITGYFFGSPFLYGGEMVPPSLPTTLTFFIFAFGLCSLAAPQIRSQSQIADDASSSTSPVLRRKFLVPALGIVATGAAVLWFSFPSQREGTLARIQREGVIRIGYSIEAPYVFLDDNGSLTGEEIETAKNIVARLAIPRIEWYREEFGTLIPDLEAGRFDIIVAGMFITPGRSQRVDFSEPTFRVRQALLVRAGNPLRLHAYEDVIKNPLAKIAALYGSIEESMIRQMEVPDSQIVSVPDALTGRVAVETGIADGLALSSPTVRFMARQEALGRTEVAQPFASPTQTGSRFTGFGAIVFRKTDDDLRQAWNRQLIGFIGSAQHRSLLTQFGFTDEELPGNVKTTEIISSGAK